MAVVAVATRMDKDSSMTVDWGEFLHHVILNPVDNIGELVSSWKHSLVRCSVNQGCAHTVAQAPST